MYTLVVVQVYQHIGNDFQFHTHLSSLLSSILLLSPLPSGLLREAPAKAEEEDAAPLLESSPTGSCTISLSSGWWRALATKQKSKATTLFILIVNTQPRKLTMSKPSFQSLQYNGYQSGCELHTHTQEEKSTQVKLVNILLYILH